MSCGVGSFPVIDESLLRRPLEARSQPDDMTYSGPFNGAGVLPYVDQSNSDGSDPHEAPFGWVENFCRKAMRQTFYACCLLTGLGTGVAFFMHFYRVLGF